MSDPTTKSESETKKSFKVVINKCWGGFGLSTKAMNMMKELKRDHKLRYFQIPRHDHDLVNVVETLGKEANGKYAELTIVTVSGPYYISAEDGKEWTVEAHHLKNPEA